MAETNSNQRLFRQQAAILVAMFNTSETVNGSVLSQNGRFSVKTLKREIAEINLNFASANGFFIESITGVGYRLVIKDAVKYQAFKEQITAKYYRYEYFRNSQADMVHYMLRRFLTGDGVFIEQIANECYCSVSTVNRCMKAVKDRLGTYGLELVNHTNSGIAIEGHEWNLRMALVNEYQIYHDFKTHAYYNPEENMEQLFLSGGAYRKIIGKAIRKVLLSENYILPFEGTRKLQNLIILTITRKKYAQRLNDDINVLKGSYETEADIIAKIFRSLPESYNISLQEIEVLSLCSFMQGARLILYPQFENREDRREIERIADGFIAELDQTYHLQGISLDAFRKDLCCNLAMLKESSENGIHASKADVRPVQNDGLLTLDLCVDLYFYLNKNGIQCTKNDALRFYYLISEMTISSHSVHPLKILVVSRYGFYYAKNLCERCARLNIYPLIEYTPCEYLMLDRQNLSEYAAIATDIDEIRQDYSQYRVVLIHYFRRSDELESVLQQVIMPKSSFRKEIFHPEDLMYTDQINDMNDAYSYIEKNIVNERAGKAAFIRDLKQKYKVFSPIRKNIFLIMNTQRNVIDSDLFKIVVLNNMPLIENDHVKIMLVTNLQDRDLENCLKLNRFIAELIHNNELLLTGDHDSDYRLLVDAMYSNNHL